jgi:polyhydroxyalkanoate synthesis regulator protein
MTPRAGEDITRSVLAQIIFEEESKTGQNLLPIAFLRQLIRFYGDSMQVLVPRYLEMSIDNLTREQHTYRDHLSKAFGATPFGSKAVEAMEAQTRANIKMFGDAMRMFTPFGIQGAAEGGGATGQDKGDAAKPAAKTAAGEDELNALKREMATMRDKLDRLSAKS